MRTYGIDTNVLLRMFVSEDDKQQSAQAIHFANRLSTDERIYVDDIVLVELLWTLRSQYGFKRMQLLDLVHALLERTEIEFTNRRAVAGALSFARRGANFADALIATHNLQQGCSHTVTFDRQAARSVPSMTLLP